jgi:hypothetical protein
MLITTLEIQALDHLLLDVSRTLENYSDEWVEYSHDFILYIIYCDKNLDFLIFI